MAYRAKNCELGIKAKKRLVELSQTQTWLCAQIEKDCGLKADTSLLSKVWRGEYKSPRIIASICRILEIKVPEEKAETLSDSTKAS